MSGPGNEPAPATPWVLAVERAYAAAATRTGWQPDDNQVVTMPPVAPLRARARGAAAAVASRYLAVGTPRSFALVVDDPAQLAEAELALAAHRVWFAPRDLRCTSAALAAAVGGRVVPVDEALAADIVCIHGATPLAAAGLRRGTHVNALGGGSIDPELARLATLVDEPRGLPALAAGLVDGRQLDEITIFVAGDAAIAVGALRAWPTGS